MFCALSWCAADVGIDGGGARVDGNFRTYLQRELTENPDFEDKEDIPDILSDGHRDFEGRCKRTFTFPSTSYTIHIGSRRMNVRSLQIAKGMLTLAGCDASNGTAVQPTHDSPSSTVQQFFKPSVDAIMRDIQQRRENQIIDVSHLLCFWCLCLFNIFRQFVILTGGFGESPYLKHALEAMLNSETSLVIANSPK
jgi:hypothetical protein